MRKKAAGASRGMLPQLFIYRLWGGGGTGISVWG